MRGGGGPAGSSQYQGVTWNKSKNKWRARSKGQHLGYHATEEEAAQAVDDYVEHGTVPEFKTGSSQFKGVSWDKSRNKWQAKSNGRYLGLHATEEEAARAVDNYVKHGTVPEPKTGSSRFKGATWNESHNKWRADSDGKYLGFHATEVAAAQAVDDYAKHGTVPGSKASGGWGSSQFKGVSWNTSKSKWQARCNKGKSLGYHATEEEAARAVDDYVKHGTVPESTRSSQFKGVCWNKSKNKWQAQCGKKSLGRHAAEKDAARAYNVEAARLGLALNVIPPAGAAGAGTGEGTGLGAGTDHTLNPPAGAAGAGADTGPGAGADAGRKRAAPKTPAAAQKNKKVKLTA